MCDIKHYDGQRKSIQCVKQKKKQTSCGSAILRVQPPDNRSAFFSSPAGKGLRISMTNALHVRSDKVEKNHISPII